MSWTRNLYLSRPIGRFRRLSDVRDFILTEYPDGPGKAWHHIGMLALDAAETGDTARLEVALQIMVAHGSGLEVVEHKRQRYRRTKRA